MAHLRVVSLRGISTLSVQRRVRTLVNHGNVNVNAVQAGHHLHSSRAGMTGIRARQLDQRISWTKRILRSFRRVENLSIKMMFLDPYFPSHQKKTSESPFFLYILLYTDRKQFNISCVIQPITAVKRLDRGSNAEEDGMETWSGDWSPFNV